VLPTTLRRQGKQLRNLKQKPLQRLRARVVLVRFVLAAWTRAGRCASRCCFDGPVR